MKDAQVLGGYGFGLLGTVAIARLYGKTLKQAQEDFATAWKMTDGSTAKNPRSDGSYGWPLFDEPINSRAGDAVPPTQEPSKTDSEAK